MKVATNGKILGVAGSDIHKGDFVVLTPDGMLAKAQGMTATLKEIDEMERGFELSNKDNFCSCCQANLVNRPNSICQDCWRSRAEC